jgi:glycosyltransferase involved in cell wall biosynthesis
MGPVPTSNTDHQRLPPDDQRLPLSCFIIARDEADRIGRTIMSVRGWVGEVVVVDSGSTDDTVAIAQALGARVFHRDWDGYGPQKRFAEECCRFDWLLNLDADEVVSPALRDEIVALFRPGPPPFAGYRLHVVDVYPGRVRPRPFAYSYKIVRLYDRRRARYAPSLVHDRVETAGQPLGRLTSEVLHHSVRSLDHQRRKLDAYFALQGREKSKPKWQIVARLPVEYPVAFLQYYLLRRHIFGGRFGLALSHVHASARTRRLMRLKRKRRAARQAGLSGHE